MIHKSYTVFTMCYDDREEVEGVARASCPGRGRQQDE